MSKETENDMTKKPTEDQIVEDAQGSLKPQSHTENDPKSKVETLSAMVGAANCMTNQELTKWYTSMIDLYPGVIKAPGSADTNRATNNMKAGGTPLAPMPIVKIKEDVDALFEGETLTEEAKERITTLFEAAVSVRVGIENARLQEEYDERLQEEVAGFIAETDQSISDYLDHTVEKWLTENEVAVVDTLRLENAEEFMGKLKDLFVESYIDIPEERLDVVHEMTTHVEEIESELTDALNEIAALRAQVASAVQDAIVESATEGLTMVDAEKLATLIESVEFSDPKDYEKKIIIIKEKHFPTVAKTKSEGVETLNEDNLAAEDRVVYVDPLVEATVRAMDQMGR